MDLRKRRALLVGTPFVAGAVVIGSATAAGAAMRAHANDGPLEQKSKQFTFTKSDHTQVSCTLTLGIITHYQNTDTQDLASYSIDNTSDCVNATLADSITWVSPENVEESDSINQTTPILFTNNYLETAVNANVGTAAFTQAMTITFNNCLNHCTAKLTLKADGKA